MAHTLERYRTRPLVGACVVLLFLLLGAPSSWCEERIRVTLKTRGLASPVIRYAVEKRIKELEGLESFSMRPISGRVEIVLESDRNLSRERIEELFDEAGLGAERARVKESSTAQSTYPWTERETSMSLTSSITASRPSQRTGNI